MAAWLGGGDLSDGVQLLRSEHDRFEAFFVELDTLLVRDVETARKRWPGVVQSVLEHEAAEHRVLWPLVCQALDDGAKVAERMRADEDAVLRFLVEVDEHGEDFAQRAAEGLRRAREHIWSEEELFPRLRRALPPEARQMLADDLREVKG